MLAVHAPFGDALAFKTKEFDFLDRQRSRAILGPSQGRKGGRA